MSRMTYRRSGVSGYDGVMRITDTNRLKLSTSRKVSPWADPVKGSKIRNCFSLPAGRNGSCPGATVACDPDRGGYCYAGRDEKRFPSVSALVNRNFEIIRNLSENDMVALLTDAVQSFADVADKKGLQKAFRIHEDGDFFSRRYARAWRRVCEAFPDVTFWCYTRSWSGKVIVTDILAGVPNLAVYVSVDTANIRRAGRYVETWKAQGIRTAIAAPGETVQETSVNLIGRKSPICPEIKGKLPLVNAQGVGACIACGLCLTAKQPILFPIHR